MISSGELSASVEFRLEDLTRREIVVGSEVFDRYAIQGEVLSGPEGWPELPSVTRFILIPSRSGVSLEIEHLESRIERFANPMPRQPLIPDEELHRMIESADRSAVVDLVTDPASLEHDGFWPPQVAELGQPAIMRGYRIIPLIIHPVRYNPRTREIEVIEVIDIDLDFSSDENMVNLVDRPDRPRPSRTVSKIVNDLVINPLPRRDPDEADGSIAYVLGTGNSWDNVLDELEPLIEWRRKMGWTVGTIRVANTQNRQTVKAAIQEAYDEWDIPPEHVVLCGDTQGQFPMAYWDVGVNIAWPYESDHQYIELEGNDVLPEAAIGRLIFQNTNMLEGIVNKTVSYESDPYIGDGDDAGWQRRGSVLAIDRLSGQSSIDMCIWTKELLLRHNYTNVSELFWDQNNPTPACQQFVRNAFEDGLSFFVFRGHLWMGRNGGFTFDDASALRNGGMLPFAMIITCNTGDYAETISSPYYFSERFAYNPNGGAIGATGCGGSSHTAYNNLYCTGAMRAVFAEDIWTQGWAHSAGLIDLYRNYADRDDIDMPENQAQEAWECHYYIINLMGDPAVDLYTTVPIDIDVEHDDLREGDSRFAVSVMYGEEEPAGDVTVCMYKPDGFQHVMWTDEEGTVLFHLDPEEVEDGDAIFLTVTGHNLMPYSAELEVEGADVFIGAGEWEIDDGEDDGEPNPAERFLLTVNVVNYGSETPEGEMVVTLSPVSRHLEVVEGEARFEGAPEEGGEVQAEFEVEIGGAFPQENDAVFDLTVVIGEASWVSAVALPVSGPQFIVTDFEWEDEPLVSASSADMQITIKNIGSKDSPALSARLISLTQTVDAPQGNGDFEAVEVGEERDSDDFFTLSANPFHLNSSPADLALILSAEDGFVDTAFFSFIVGVAGEGDPFGPDDYGYICIDDTDADWVAIVPHYEWIEIDPDEGDIEGVNTELSDNGQGGGGLGGGGDASVVIDLPFPFQYYGEEFNEVTICTNGWMALGDREGITTARNCRIPGGMVPPALIAPFWNDLVTTNEGGVFYWYDRDNHRFIVEWSHMDRLAPGNRYETTFEVILLDPAHHPTLTNDGDIIFQYLEVEQQRERYNWDTPYATVGIGNPDQNDGLQYTYWNELHPGAAPVENERAIKFTTMRSFAVGSAEGWVTDFATRDSIAGATIITSFGYAVITDSSGYYFIDDMLVPEGLDTTYTFQCTMQYYNDSTRSGIDIIEDSTMRVDFALLHPEFVVSEDEIFTQLMQDADTSFDIMLSNDGNGPLYFSSYFDFHDLEDEPERDEIWDPLLEVDVTNTVIDIVGEDSIRLGNTRILGTVYVDSMFYVAGGGDVRDSLYAKIYRFTRDGEFIDSLALPWMERYAIRGMAYDGRYVWSVYDRWLFKFNPEDMSPLDSIELPNRAWQARDVAYDRENDVIYTCGISEDIYALDTLGNVIDRWDINMDGARIFKYGLAWYADQPDSLRLFVFCKIEDSEDHLVGFNPFTGDLRDMAILGDQELDSPLGIDVTNDWNASVWTIVTTLGRARADRFVLWELDPNTTWISYSPITDTLNAGEEIPIHIELAAGLRPFDRYWIIIHYDHNAVGEFQEIPVIMDVVRAYSVNEDDAGIPREFGLLQNWPNPFNPTTRIDYILDKDAHVSLTIWDITGRMVGTLTEDQQLPGHHSITFNAGGLPNGVYIYRLEADGRVDVRKMVLLK